MKAVVYHGPRNVSVDEVPDAKIERSTDVLVKITSTNICGSDLHMYEGRTSMAPGRILGHENLGVVIEVGPGVDRIKVGDRVYLPFNIGCGFRANCEKGLSGYCLTVNPGNAGGAYGFAGIERVMDLTGGQGADRGCECVGYQCCNMHRKEVPNLTMNNLVQTVKATGRIGVVGVFLPEDPQAKDKLAKRGQLAFDFGQFWFKGQSIGTGQANMKAYNRPLSKLIEHNKVKPSWIVSHELPLTRAPEAYGKFDKRVDGWTKVVLQPGK